MNIFEERYPYFSDKIIGGFSTVLLGLRGGSVILTSIHNPACTSHLAA